MINKGSKYSRAYFGVAVFFLKDTAAQGFVAWKRAGDTL